jgi:hypothetical protein
MVEELKKKVYEANLDLVRHGLVIFTMGKCKRHRQRKGIVVISRPAYPTKR